MSQSTKHRDLVRVIAVLLFAASLAAAICSQTLASGFQNATPSAGIETFDIKSDPQFSAYKKTVTDFAWAKRPGSANDFCIVGYRTGDNLKNAYVIWRQGREIIFWFGGTQSLASAQRVVHLDSDVVTSDRDLHGSTYFVTAAWVLQVKSTCAESGVMVHVPKRGASKRH